MTSIEAVRRARSHTWMELNDQTEGCLRCQLVLPKSTDLENIPGCTDIKVCPECFLKGKYESRVLINGRGYYHCPNEHRWQDLDEKSSTKGTIL